MPSDNEPLHDRLHRLFLEELDQHVDGLRSGLDHLAAVAPEVPGETIEELFRSAHSLKGAAQAVGASVVARHCHELEDALSRVRDGSRSPDAALLVQAGATVDAITEAGAAFRAGGAHRPTEPVRGRESAAAGSAAATTRGGTVRVAQHHFDSLLAQAGDVITASYRSEGLVRRVADASERISRSQHAWSGDLHTLRTAVAGAPRGVRADMVLSRLNQQLRGTSEELERLAGSATRQQRSLRAVVDRFAAAAQRARAVPFTDATTGLNRLVRELAGETGKQVRLVVAAQSVEMDKALVGDLRDALGHLVRNAVDHGIELPEQRIRQGKPGTGTVTVSAHLLAQGIEVVVSDDGGGVQTDHVRRAAGALGLEELEGDLEEMLFHPGLSTAAAVNPYSGRGVGLDAVRSAVESAGGVVSLDTEPGVGTRVRVTMPVSLSTVPAVLAEVGDDLVALPASAVRCIISVPADPPSVGGREVVPVDEQAVPLVSMAVLLGWQGTGGPADERTAMVLESGDESVAVLVGSVLSGRDIILHSVPRRLAGLSLLLGTTQLEDGTVAIVLSPAACVRAGVTGDVAERRGSPGASTTPRILLVEDTVTTRELERSILELAGYSVLVAADGAQAWQMLQMEEVDAVVSDIDMPRMDGVALCRAIRASRGFVDLPVILVTSLDSDADRTRGLDAGADAYLPKTGFDRGELLDVLERVL